MYIYSVEFTVGSNNLQTARLALSNTTKLATQLANSAPPSAVTPLVFRRLCKNEVRCPHLSECTSTSSPIEVRCPPTMKGPPTPPNDLVPKVCGWRTFLRTWLGKVGNSQFRYIYIYIYMC